MLALALALDAWLGEPQAVWRRFRHPVVLIGALIDWLERALNRGRYRRLRGVLAVVLLLGLCLPVPIVLANWAYGWPLEILGAAILLAHRSLVDHVRAVAEALPLGLDDGRRAVARIVGRDPETLDQSGVSRAAIESAAENFSDGVVAPAFWFAVAGLPGIVAYKAVNTADSMIGHINERYHAFGWAAARLDDVLNWVPARLTGCMFLIAGRRPGGFQTMLRDAPGHRSPNAGWPEAAMAASLDVALAGPRVYGGALTDDPYMNAAGRRETGPRDILNAVDLLWLAWRLLLALACLGSIIRYAW